MAGRLEALSYFFAAFASKTGSPFLNPTITLIAEAVYSRCVSAMKP